MDHIDSKILLICRKKDKIKLIRSMLSQKNNFEAGPGPDGSIRYRVFSNSEPGKSYQVLKTDMGRFSCDCIFNQRWIKYTPGEKKVRKKPECAHILALKVYLAIQNLNNND